MSLFYFILRSSFFSNYTDIVTDIVISFTFAICRISNTKSIPTMFYNLIYTHVHK